MDERIERLNQIAQQGNIDAFYSLIREDVSLLENMDKLPLVDTPLHKAASAGHTRFAMEMMRLKPSFARKLNPDGFSPMHLALQNDQTQMVLRLLEVDGDLACIQGREGVTSLHHAVETGDLYLVAKFLSVCPNSIKDVTIRSETALHIALKTDQSGAFELLVGWLRRSWFKNALLWEKRVVNWEDEEGNTALHVAASKNQPQAVKQLLNCSIDVNAKNLMGYTALDILQQQTVGDYKEIKDMLCRAGALNASSLPPVTTLAEYLRSTVLIQEKLPLSYLRERTKISSDMRNVLLVVAALLVTVTYQAALSPPGGVWQDDYNPDTNDHQFNTTAPGIIINEVSPSLHTMPGR
ncbi:ankyrin repeat-containing protein BDA1-like [Castanea sativa]|uniref:ankyrin repeat-containing protein BDA1-like n=1 Tax=Castanea sativa TaxID=21020 RepID=UPI003F64ED66